MAELKPDTDAPLAAETGGRLGGRILLLLLVSVPLAWISERAGWPTSVSFLLAIVGMIPLAGYLGRATQEIAIKSTPALGALMAATFGNAVELLIGVRLLLGSSPDAAQVVRGSIVGSLVTNLLLLIGLSMLAGGLKYREQKFNQTAAGVSASLLIIAFAGVSIPTVFAKFVGPAHVGTLSRVVSVILALVYVAGLVFTIRTHRHLFDAVDELRGARRSEWPVRKALLVLLVTTLTVAFLGGVLERTLDGAGRQLGLSKLFVGVIVLGVITNVAENLSAIAYARQNLIDLSIQIGTSSTIQINLFVVPILVLLGAAMGRPLDLNFTLFELAAMLLPVMIINHLATDGVCNWLEGLLLVALYAIIATAFFFA
ncbi:MAG TPA: calcium/proton exchanger [Planctomycetota bacterium]|jgi:Ca2+:H+ antiporter|nr:calcium/proton exchanger [Planctomycetota bacterium]